jgi:hypothetical protein
MRHVRPALPWLLATTLITLPGCDVIGGHGRVNVTNGTGVTLSSIQVVHQSGDERSGSVAPGGFANFTNIPAGSVQIYGYGDSPTAITAASGTVEDGKTISVTLTLPQ